MSSLVPSTEVSVVMLTRSPSLSSISPPATRPMRIFGPGRSWRAAGGRGRRAPVSRGAGVAAGAPAGEVARGPVAPPQHEALEERRPAGGGPDGGDDLGAAQHGG